MRSTRAQVIRSAKLAIGTVALLVLLPPSAEGAQWRTVAQDSGRGLVTAATPIASPGSLRVTVTASGSHNVVYSTAISCDRSPSRVRRYTGRTTVRRGIAKPGPAAPRMCLVGSSAKRRDGGRVVVKIQQRR